jgi:hypothetical protein
MKPDVVSQLRKYLKTVDSVVPPVTIEEPEQTASQWSVASERVADTDLMEWLERAGSGSLTEIGNDSATVEVGQLQDDDVTVVELLEGGQRPFANGPRRWIVVAVAVAAAALVVVGMVAVNTDNDEVATDPAVTETPRR